MILFLDDFSDLTQCMSFLSFSLLKQVENTFVSHYYHWNTGFHTPILINKICKKYKQEPYMIIDTDFVASNSILSTCQKPKQLGS